MCEPVGRGSFRRSHLLESISCRDLMEEGIVIAVMTLRAWSGSMPPRTSTWNGRPHDDRHVS